MAVFIDCPVPTHSSTRVGADPAGELADRGLALLAALGDDVGGPELACAIRWRDSWRDIATTRSAPMRDAARTPDRPTAPSPTTTTVSPCFTPGGDGGVPAGAHDVGERQQRRDQAASGTSGVATRVPSASGHAGVLALTAVDRAAVAVLGAPEAAVRAGGLDAGPAVRAGVVGVHERRDDEVAGADGADLGADLLDDADELVADAASPR